MAGSLPRLLCAIACAVALIASTHSAPATTVCQRGTERLNVLLIVVEDLGTELGCYGDEYAHTPRLDRLAQEGVLYSAAYAVSSTSAVSSAALMSALYPSSIGAQHDATRGRLPDGVQRWSARLRAAGYWCGLAGEMEDNLQPSNADWDATGSAAHWRACPADRPFFCLVPLQITAGDRERLDDEAFATATAALDVSQRHDPALAKLRPHWPDQADVRELVARRADLVSVLDARVGELLDELHAAKLASKTLVLFCGTNGVGLWRGKQSLYDAGLRVPFLLRLPDAWRHLAPERAGNRCERLISLVDVGPTLESLLGIASPRTLHGRAFLGPRATAPRLYTHAIRDRVEEREDFVRAVRDERYTYLRHYLSNYPPGGSPAGSSAYLQAGPGMQAVRRAQAAGRMPPQGLRALQTKRRPEELYDSKQDPDQLHDLAFDPRYRRVLERMRAAHANWAARTYDLSVLPEGEMRRAAAGYNLWEWARAAHIAPDWATIRSAAWHAPLAHPAELWPGLASESAAVRYWALIGLADDTRKLAAKSARLLPLLSDTSPDVRLTAASLIVATTDSPRGLDTLKKGLASADPYVRLRALGEIERLGERALSLDEFARNLFFEDPDTRVAVLAASALLAISGWDPAQPAVRTSDSQGRPNPAAEVPAGAPTILVEGTRVELLAEGRIVHAARYPLAQALRLSQPGDVIGIRGNVGRVGFGVSDPGKQWVAMHAGGKPVTGVTILGLDPDRAAIIEGASFDERYGRPDDLRFENLTFENQAGSFSPFLTSQNNIIGSLTCYDCDFRSAADSLSKFGGKGMKWGMRLNGPCRMDMRRCRFWPAQEHSIYVDNLQGDSYFIDIEGGGNSRTGLQIVNRPHSGPTGFGDVWIERCRFHDNVGSGGSDFTVAGHLGRIFIVDCESLGAEQGSLGALMIWSPNNPLQGGRYLDDEGFATKELWLENFRAVHPNSDRPHLSITGVGRVEIRGSLWVEGNRPALDLDPYSEIDNGHVHLDLGERPSESAGWQARLKIRHRGRELSAAEIDALAVEEE